MPAAVTVVVAAVVVVVKVGPAQLRFVMVSTLPGGTWRPLAVGLRNPSRVARVTHRRPSSVARVTHRRHSPPDMSDICAASLKPRLNAPALTSAPADRPRRLVRRRLREGPVDGDPAGTGPHLQLPGGYLPRRDRRGDPGLEMIRRAYGVDFRRNVGDIVALDTDVPRSRLTPDVFLAPAA